jgi:hypothetical protein
LTVPRAMIGCFLHGAKRRRWYAAAEAPPPAGASAGAATIPRWLAYR